MKHTKKTVTMPQYHQHTCPLCEKEFDCRRPTCLSSRMEIAQIASEG